MSGRKHLTDSNRRELAVKVRAWSISDLLSQFEKAGVYRAFIIFENGVFTLSHSDILAPIQALLELSQDFAEHEGIFIGREEGIETLFFAFVHDTRRGLAQGGLRFVRYETVADVLIDGLRLSQGMTRKNALAALWWGGGKGIIPLLPGFDHPDHFPQGAGKDQSDRNEDEKAERRRLFEAYGRFVASLGGVYYTAEDVGTKTADMDAVLSQNRFTTCISEALGGSGNPSPFTAQGVLRGMQAAWLFLTGTESLTGVRVAVQGAGNVGRPLIELLDHAGANVWISDVNTQAIQTILDQRPHVQVVSPDEVFDLDVDILAPCARGGVVNSETIPRLKVRLICGAANNILKEDRYDPERLRERGIMFVPDYVCNRMGITNCADEWLGYLSEDVRVAAERVFPDTLRVLRYARNLVITPTQAANELADIAASELHPLLGHRGRRIIDHLVASGWSEHKPTAENASVGPRQRRRAQSQRSVRLFDPVLDEPRIRVNWDKQGRFRGEGRAIAAAPISAAAKPNLASFLSSLLLDVRARYLESVSGQPPRRVLGSDHGGLGLQFAVESSLPYEREEIGRAEFIEKCHDYYNGNDAAIREQLHQLGVGFDPQGWLDPMDEAGKEVVKRQYYALDDAGLIARETCWVYQCPRCQTILVASDVKRDRLKLSKEYTIRFKTTDDRVIETRTPFPEMLVGAVAVAVNSGGPFSSFAGQSAKHPLLEDELPVIAVDSLASSAMFLVPSHSPADEHLARSHGISKVLLVFDRKGNVRGYPDMPVERARQLVLGRLDSDVTDVAEREPIEVHRCRRCQSIVYPEVSEQLFVRMASGVELLRNGIQSGAVSFAHDEWRNRVLTYLDVLDPWCISRQQWWGNELPTNSQEILSTWFSLVAWSLRGAGWPNNATPSPISEVFADPDLLIRWVIPSLVISYMITGRPVFQTVHVHGALNILERSLERRGDVSESAPDEERFLYRTVRRPMRHSLGNVVEPSTVIERFGADALRLGYLLGVHSGFHETATASESQLREARRSVHLFVSKLTGLLNMVSPGHRGEAQLADSWIIARTQRAIEKVQKAYEANRLDEAARILIDTIDSFVDYVNTIAERRREGNNLGAARSTAAIVIALLEPAFSPICPYLFERLGNWVREKCPEAGATPTADLWLSDLVDYLSSSRKETLEVSAPDPAILDLLDKGRSELERLSKTRIIVAASPSAGKPSVVGPCIVVQMGELNLLQDGSSIAEWYNSLHGLRQEA